MNRIILSLKSIKVLYFFAFIGLLLTIFQWQERETIHINLEILDTPEFIVIGFQPDANAIHSIPGKQK